MNTFLIDKLTARDQRASREEMRGSPSRSNRPPPAHPNCCFSTIFGNFFANYVDGRFEVLTGSKS